MDEALDSGIGKNIDRISSLPDSILCHILSFLPTKYSVGTSFLSKRWQFLWMSVPVLDFDDNLLFRQKTQNVIPKLYVNFTKFVDRVMLMSAVPCFRKFQIKREFAYNSNLVDIWICAALRRNVQELDLRYMHLREPVCLPRQIFTSESLVFVNLEGYGILLEVPASVWLPSLKKLYVNVVIFKNCDSVERLLFGCPALEELSIKRWNWERRWGFNFSIPTLKRLYVDFFVTNAKFRYVFDESEGMDESESIDESEVRECKVVVNAPKLEELHLMDNASMDYSVENLSSLLEARVIVGRMSTKPSGFRGANGPICRLLSGLAGVKFLSLSSWTLASVADVIDHVLPTFHRMTRLELGIDGCSCWDMMTDFLECSPNLEVLILEKEAIHLESATHWSPPRRVPTCLLLHLKEIEIKEFGGKEYEVEAIKYLLGNGKVLKKMTIDCQFSISKKEFRVCKNMSKFPRASKTCQLNLLF